MIETYSRQYLATEVDQGIRAGQVVAVLERLKQEHGRAPARITGDNGSEFISKALDKWA